MLCSQCICHSLVFKSQADKLQGECGQTKGMWCMLPCSGRNVTPRCPKEKVHCSPIAMIQGTLLNEARLGNKLKFLAAASIWKCEWLHK